jgi:CBS domain-containing protein
MMQARNVMSSNIYSVDSVESLAAVAQIMGRLDIGALPVIDGRKLVGIVTDRDLAVRGLGQGLPEDTPVSQIMTREVVTCRETDDLDDVIETMTYQQIRRVPVCSASGEVVGIISLGDLACRDWDKDEVGQTLGEICRPQGLHCQALQPA